MEGASFVAATIIGLVIYILKKRKTTGREALVNETDAANNEVQTVSDETRRGSFEQDANEEIEDENGIVNPVYIAAQTNEIVEQACSKTTIKQPGMELAGTDQTKGESSC